jgi:hypothetical protein
MLRDFDAMSADISAVQSREAIVPACSDAAE